MRAGRGTEFVRVPDVPVPGPAAPPSRGRAPTNPLDRETLMAQITLDDDEVQILAAALRSYLSDLRMEVAGTDSYDFREALKRQESALSRVLEQIGGAEEPADGAGPA